MLPGPVFNVELTTTARRARYYFARFAYGMILLFIIGQSFPWYYYRTSGGPGEVSIQQMARIGQSLFTTFAIVQGFAVLFLTPTLVAGVIADERQRKTLHYLLASRLSSGEIILGKLAARLLHVGVFLGLGLPILSLLSLFGGVDPLIVIAYYAGTITTVFFLASLSILVSTYARRPREAISLVYVLEVAWLFLPPMIDAIGPQPNWPWNEIYPWIAPVNAWVAASSPGSLLPLAARAFGRGPGAFIEALLWMMGLQAIASASMIVLAVARLRPIFRKEGERGHLYRWMGAASRGRRFLSRPECGDDAMLWKERYVSRTSASTKILGGLVVFACLLGLFYGTYDFAKPAFIELWGNGYSSDMAYSARMEFNVFLRFVGTFLYIVWALGVASASSSGLSSEREEDTWTSLIATPLGGLEIIRAKMIGAVWGTRGLGVLLLSLWLVGLATGAVHPFGFAAVVVATPVFLWFVDALGTYISLWSKSTGRALVTTVAILFVLNGGYMMCCIPLQPDTMLIAAGVTPMIEAVSLLSYRDFNEVFFSSPMGQRGPFDMFATCVVGLIGYAVAATALTSMATTRFDEAADRPRRSSFSPPNSSFEKPKPDDEGAEL
jgi:ABC-type Na+ efflux pump permease subunit